MKLRHIKKENGQAMVEFALVLPILLLFIGGIIDFGWIFHNQILVNNATREATRYIAVYYYADEPPMTDASAQVEVRTQIINRVGSKIIIPNSEPKLKVEPDGKYGKKVTVDLSGELDVLTPILSTIIGEKYTIKSKCIMRVENN